MSNSTLISGTLLSPNHSGLRNHKIDRITPHYMAGLLSAEQCCEIFRPTSRKASSNYCIGKDGEIWLCVEEKNRAWTSGSSYNDNRAITIECANYSDSSLPQATWNSLVALCVDICRRNGFRLNYTGDDSGNLTMHKWYQSTDCPGEWFSKQFGRLATEVNGVLDGLSPDPITPHNNTHGGTLDVDGWLGYNTVLDMQHAMGTFEDGNIDGQYSGNSRYHPRLTAVTYDGGGSPLVKRMQEKLGIDADGYWGIVTSASLQEWLKFAGYDVGSAGIDGIFGAGSAMALQMCLNEGKFTLARGGQI